MPPKTDPRGTDPPSSALQIEKEQFMQLVSKTLADGNFESVEEANAMLAELVGRNIGEVVAENQGDPKSPRNRALALLERITWENPPQKNRRIAKKATEVDPEFCEAWLQLAYTYESEKMIVKNVRRAIEVGRREHAALIDQALNCEEPWLWGFPEARPLMRAYHELGMLYLDMFQIDEATEVFEEMLRLNFGDNQGVRYELLTCFLMREALDAADALIARYPEDSSCAWQYGKALLEYLRALAGADPSAPDGGVEDADLGRARGALAEAVRSNPYAVFLLGDPRCMEIQPPPSFSFHSPAEALIFAQGSRMIWLATGGVFWLYEVVFSADPELDVVAALGASDPGDLEEFFELVEELEAIRPDYQRQPELNVFCDSAQLVREGVFELLEAKAADA